jgi:hypothetical protein
VSAPPTWRVRILRASPSSVVTGLVAHLASPRGGTLCGKEFSWARSRPAPIDATHCSACRELEARD